nr:MAG TPA: hypothetical protein [Caudoviricetes sp.]
MTLRNICQLFFKKYFNTQLYMYFKLLYNYIRRYYHAWKTTKITT